MSKLIETAQKYIGLTEVPGTSDNPIIMNWAKKLGISYGGDSVAWCALFVSWVAYEAGYKGLRTLAARKWLEVGTPIQKPEIGCIAILWRKDRNGPFGHVGIVSAYTENTVTLLGGNQSQKVGYDTFPKTRVLGYRRLTPLNGGEKQPTKVKTWIVVSAVAATTVLVSVGIYLAVSDNKK